jgi:hypothetical protein
LTLHFRFAKKKIQVKNKKKLNWPLIVIIIIIDIILVLVSIDEIKFALMPFRTGRFGTQNRFRAYRQNDQTTWWMTLVYLDNDLKCKQQGGMGHLGA